MRTAAAVAMQALILRQASRFCLAGLFATKFEPFESVFEAVDPLLLASLCMIAHLPEDFLRLPLQQAYA
jgi:hypothetical protein